MWSIVLFRVPVANLDLLVFKESEESVVRVVPRALRATAVLLVFRACLDLL